MSHWPPSSVVVYAVVGVTMMHATMTLLPRESVGKGGRERERERERRKQKEAQDERRLIAMEMNLRIKLRRFYHQVRR